MDKSKYTAIAAAVTGALLRAHELPPWQQDWRRIEYQPGDATAAPALMAEIYKRLGVEVRHTDGSECPIFRGDEDRVEIPHLTAFTDSEAYLAAAFHELTHWTGGEKRFNRPRWFFVNLLAEDFKTPEDFEKWLEANQNTPEGEKYTTAVAKKTKALEEMTAEFGVVFMLTAHGIEVPVNSCAKYLASYASEFAEVKEGFDVSKALVLAMREARKATEWMLERTGTVQKSLATTDERTDK